MADELARWLSWTEGQTFERKSCWDQSQIPPRRLEAREVARQIAETLCAMANADGGVLLVGQEDVRVGREAAGAVTGVDYGESTIAQLRDAPRRLLVPPLTDVEVREETWESHRLLLFQTGSSPRAHRLTDGRCLLRVGDNNVPYSEQVAARLKENQSPYERRPVPEAHIDDLDADALTWFAQKIGWSGDSAALLRAYRLFDGAHLNRAALLLFAHEPLRWQDHTDVTLVRYAGTERGLGPNYRATPPLRLEAPLVRLIDRVQEALGAQLERFVGLRDLFFEEMLEYPPFAWQEAIVNAIAHRDYLLTGAGTEIWLFDDRMEVRSPGPPLVPIEELQAGGGMHLSRNPLLARVLIDAGYMREQGEGIPRMFQAMESADLLPPQFSLEHIRFIVTLRNTPVYDAETRRWLRRFDDRDLSREQKRVLAFARSRNLRFTNRDVQKLLRVDLYAAQMLIRALIRKGVVRLTEPRGRIYEVVQQPDREPLPKALAVLMPTFKRQAAITNRELQVLWNLPPHQAYRRARSLVEANWLELRGVRRAAAYYLTERAKNATV